MPDERRREELRRALYRPGSGGDEVRAYLEVAPAGPGPAAAPSAPQRRAAASPATDAVRARRPVLAALVALLVLAATAATGPPPPLVLPDPRAGTFSAPFPVTAPAVTVRAARSGAVPVWSAVRSTSRYARTGGVAVAAARGSIRLSAVIDHVAAAHEPEGPLTVFVACDGRPVRIAFFTQVADFDEGYSAELNERSIPCTGIAAVRYRPPRGIVADGILVSVGGSGDIALSVVEGL